jgi:hypothetical protein
MYMKGVRKKPLRKRLVSKGQHRLLIPVAKDYRALLHIFAFSVRIIVIFEIFRVKLLVERERKKQRAKNSQLHLQKKKKVKPPLQM